MTRQETLDIISLVIRMHQAAGDCFDIIPIGDDMLKLTPAGKDRTFDFMFISDFSAVCRENFIAFTIGAENNQPYILL